MKTEWSAEELRSSGIRVEDDDVVQISGALYVKTPEALTRVMEDLKTVGYEVKDCRDEDRKNRGHSVEKQEKNGWYLWYARLKNIRKGKCNSCKQYVPTLGIRAHGTTCSHCGEVLYREIVDGSTIKFTFTKSEWRIFGYQPIFTAKHWDVENEALYLYRAMEARSVETGCGVTKGVKYFIEPHEDEELLWVTMDNGELVEVFASRFNEVDVKLLREREAHLAENAALPDGPQWVEEEYDGIKCIRVRYMRPWSHDQADINPSNIMGGECNSTIVKVWKGKEYSEWDGIPVPESFSIYEAWHWDVEWPRGASLHEKVMSAAGQVSRQDYYYQDGRPAFSNFVFGRMRKFIDHFTEIPVGEFDANLRRMRKDGPGFIEDLAAFCSGEEIPEVRNEPNMWNTVGALCDVAGGKQLTSRQVDAAANGMKDKGWDGFGLRI